MTDTLTRPQAVNLAQQMRDGGWISTEIRAYLAERGHDVAVTTIRRWTDPELAERRRKNDRELTARKRTAASEMRLGRHDQTSIFRWARMGALRRLGISYEAIARIMSFDYPDTPLTEVQVRHALNSGRPPRVFRSRT